MQQPLQLIVRRKIFHLNLRIGCAQMLGVFPLRPFQRSHFAVCNPDKAIFYLYNQIEPLGIPPGNRFYDTAFYDLQVRPP
ncbi:MAG: hypothetical protein PUI40_05850 [Oscillospiraceae bacterium]|nr:hypothetical protein [Oscillospiraceae bacterium]